MRARAPRVAHRIAYLMGDHPRLSQTFVAQEIEELRRSGWDIVPFSLNSVSEQELVSDDARAEAARTFYVKAAGPSAVMRAATRLLARRPIGTMRFLAGATGGLGLDLRAQLWRLFHCGMAMVVRDRCRAAGVSHVHAQFGGAPATVAWLVRRLDEAVGDGTLTWSYTVHGPHEFMDERRSQLDRKTRSASFTACICDHQRSQLMRLAGPEAHDRIHVVRVGIDLQRFVHRPPGPLHDPPTVLSVARYDTEKGLHVLVDAVAELRGRGRRVVADIIGNGPLRDELEAHARALGVDDDVHLLGPRPPAEVAARLRDTDVFCLPSFAEGLPVSIMEAMATGVPVVATYVNGVPELAVDGRTACVVPAGNTAALADAVESLLADPELRARLSADAVLAVRERHELHTNVAQLAALFASVIDGSRA